SENGKFKRARVTTEPRKNKLVKLTLLMLAVVGNISCMHDAAAIERIRRKFQALTMVMDERMRRQWAAAEAMELAWGGASCVSKATGISRTTILVGLRELGVQECSLTWPSPSLRRPGAGRKPL